MVVEVGYRPPPSVIPIALLSSISVVSSVHTYVRRKPHPIIMSGALCGGVLMAVAASNIRKRGATKDNLLSAAIGSGLMGMTACEAIIKTSSPVYKAVLICSLSSMVYYANEHIARYGPIHRTG